VVGTSAEAIYQLEKGGLRTVLSRAVWAAYQKSKLLGESQQSSRDPNGLPSFDNEECERLSVLPSCRYIVNKEAGVFEAEQQKMKERGKVRVGRGVD